MSYKTKTIPDLDERFLEPPEWRWHGFTRKGRTIRFGSAFPKDSIPDAVVVCLPGLSEFAEKYFELARQCLDKNLAFWVLDWAGQGRSTRYLKNPHKRHGVDFQEDVDDLHYFVMEYIKHASVHPDVGRIPLAMLGHSMGANIGLRYLSQHDGLFECAAFTAPMFGLKIFKSIPLAIALVATSAINTLAGGHYVPSGKDWLEETRADHNNLVFSSDPIRSTIHNSWCLSNPDIQIGNVTYGWVNHATRSCNTLQKKKVLNNVSVPCLITTAGKEELVDNTASIYIAHALKHAELVEYPDAAHEILMEKDEIRNDFIERFYQLIKESIVDRPETLKPF
jgi:lysophospholipase